ncbi:MAG: CHAT domain-containing protein [Geodermatophilaceae bacterium]
MGDSPDSAAQLAARALDLVGADPRAAQECAERAVRRSRSERDPVARSTALRALGLAHKRLGDLPAGIAALRSAVQTARRVGNADAAAEARMSLAFALLDRGSVGAALAQAERAAVTLRGLPAARLRAQRGLILQRCGRLDEALEDFRRALPVLHRGGDRMWEARLRNNRGLLHAVAGRLPAAETDLRRAAALYEQLGQPLAAAEATWNLGYVAARAGDLPAALARYDATEASYRQTGLPAPELLYDRAELLLSAGLAEEAAAAAAAAAQIMTELGTDTSLAETHLLQAQAVLSGGDPQLAGTLSAQVTAGFRRQQRPGWALVAEYVGLRAAAAGQLGPAQLRQGRRLGPALAAAGWYSLALDARLITARAALATGARAEAEDLLRTAAAARRTDSVDIQIRAWHAEALLRQHTRPGSVRSALDAGLRALDRHRAGLGATELRVHAAAHGRELTELGLALAVQAGDAERVLAWTERWRAWTLRLPPVRPPEDAELAGLLTDLRQVTTALEAALLDQRPGAAALRRQQAALESEIQAVTRRLPGTPHGTPPGPPTVAQLRDRLGPRALIAYVDVAGTLSAVVLVDGRAGLYRLGETAAVADDLAVVHFGLRRMAARSRSVSSATAAMAAAATGAVRLQERILARLLPVVGDRDLVVVPANALHGLPWSQLPALVGRPLAVAPSATAWHRADGIAVPDRAGPAVLVAGPGLPGARAEIAALAAANPGARCLSDGAATVAATLQAMDGASWAHLATHGRLRTDNPLFSALELADGRLTVYDLERLTRPPGLVVLAACQAGVGAVRAGEETLGLANALLAMGTRTLVATCIPVPDEASAPLMLGMHARLAAGVPVAAALAATASGVDRDDPAALAAAAGFNCLGTG